MGKRKPKNHSKFGRWIHNTIERTRKNVHIIGKAVERGWYKADKFRKNLHHIVDTVKDIKDKYVDPLIDVAQEFAPKALSPAIDKFQEGVDTGLDFSDKVLDEADKFSEKANRLRAAAMKAKEHIKKAQQRTPSTPKVGGDKSTWAPINNNVRNGWTIKGGGVPRRIPQPNIRIGGFEGYRR